MENMPKRKGERRAPRCPDCRSHSSEVVTSRWLRREDEYKRYRKCECGTRFYTLEIPFPMGTSSYPRISDGGMKR